MTSNSSSGAAAGTVMASLPVLENYVPDAVVARVKDKFANTVYDITSIKQATGMVYMVRTTNNGTFKTDIINEDGTVAAQGNQ